MVLEAEPFELSTGFVSEFIESFFLLLIMPFLSFQK